MPNVKIFEFVTPGDEVLIVPAVIAIIWLGIDVKTKAFPAE